MGWPTRLVLNLDTISTKPEKSLSGKLSEILGASIKKAKSDEKIPQVDGMIEVEGITQSKNVKDGNGNRKYKSSTKSSDRKESKTKEKKPSKIETGKESIHEKRSSKESSKKEKESSKKEKSSTSKDSKREKDPKLSPTKSHVKISKISSEEVKSRIKEKSPHFRSNSSSSKSKKNEKNTNEKRSDKAKSRSKSSDKKESKPKEKIPSKSKEKDSSYNFAYQKKKSSKDKDVSPPKRSRLSDTGIKV